MAQGPAARTAFEPGKGPFHVKGVTYRNLFDYLEEHLEGGRVRLLDALGDPALRAFADQPFLASSLYDVMPIQGMCETAATLMGKPLAAFVRDFSRQAAERDIRGIYKMLLKLVSPGMVMERVPAAARQYFDFVSATVEKLAPNRYRSSALGVPEVLMHFYMLVTEAFLGRALTLAGAFGLEHRWLPPHPDGHKDGLLLMKLQREISWR
jgi:hypothetical protein